MKTTGAKKPRRHILKSDCWCKPTVTTTISKDGKEKVTVISHHDQPMTTKNDSTIAYEFHKLWIKMMGAEYDEAEGEFLNLIAQALQQKDEEAKTQRTALIEQIEREVIGFPNDTGDMVGDEILRRQRLALDALRKEV